MKSHIFTCANQAADVLLSSIVALSRFIPADILLPVLTKVLHTLAGNFNDDTWKAMEQSIDLCGKPGCDCHNHKLDLMALLSGFRASATRTGKGSSTVHHQL